MNTSIGCEALNGIEDRDDVKGTGARLSAAIRRGAVVSYEQIVAGTELLRDVAPAVAVLVEPPHRVEVAAQIIGEDLVRDPLAHPVSPLRPPGAAKPAYEVVPDPVEPGEIENVPVFTRSGLTMTELTKGEELTSSQAALVVEPLEPAAEPRHRGSIYGGVEKPVRSMLSPSQRMAAKRPETRLDQHRRPTYITYTGDDPGKK